MLDHPLPIAVANLKILHIINDVHTFAIIEIPEHTLRPNKELPHLP